MSKRFIDTELWTRDWFMEMPPAYKCAFIYLLTQCDGVGVWKPNFKLANYQIGQDINWEEFRRHVNGNIEVLPNKKWWVKDFIKFQYGHLRENFRLHQTYITLLHKHNLYEKVMNTRGTEYLQEQDKEQDKELEQEKDNKIDGVAAKELYNFIYHRFASTPGYDFKKDGKAIKYLVQKALVWPRGSPRDFLDGVITVFERLTKSGDRFWCSQPFLPSVLNAGGIWPRVLKEIENRAGKANEARQQYQQSAQVAAKIWGKK